MRGPAPWQTNRSRSLRSATTSAELKLWSRLRNRQLGGFKFVRQEAIGAYFADFVCREANLVIEVDGGTHGEPHEVENDAVRTDTIEALGYRIMRVWNGDVYENPDGVLDMILAALEKRT